MRNAVLSVSGLDALERDVLTVLALDDEPWLSRTAWKDKASRAGIVDARGRQLTGEVFKELARALTAKGPAVLVGNGGYAFAVEWLAPVLDDAERRGRLRSLADCLSRDPRAQYRWLRGRLGVIADLRLALASGRPDDLATAERTFADHERAYGVRAPTAVAALGLDIPAEWVARLADHRRAKYLDEACQGAFVETRVLGAGLRHAIVASERPELRGRLSTIVALEGNIAAAHELVREGSTAWERGARAFLAYVEGDHARAREQFAAAGVGSRKQRVELPGYLAVFDLLLAATSDDAGTVTEVQTRLGRAKSQLKLHPAAKEALEQIASFRASGRKPEAMLHYRSASWIDLIFCRLAAGWTGARSIGADDIMSHAARARIAGYLWLASELETVGTNPKASKSFAMLGRREAWQLALDALKKAIVSDASEVASPKQTGESTVWWTIEVRDHGVDVEAYLASPRAPKGKKLSLARLRDDDKVPLDARDIRARDAVIAAYERGSWGLPSSVLAAFVGHPRVRDVAGRTVEVVLGEARLAISGASSGALLRMCPARFDESGIAATVEAGGGRIVVVRRTPPVARALAVVGPEGIRVPKAGLSAMSEVLGAIAGHLPVDAEGSFAEEDLTTDERIHLQLFRYGNGLRARFRVMPAGPQGTSLRPGVPPEETIVRSGDGPARVRRDLAAERARVEELLGDCPTLASLPQEGDDRVAGDLVTCLELLVELGAAGEGIVVSWPEGQPLRAPAVRSAGDFRVRVGGDVAWLVIDGEVRVDEERVLAMRELLSATSRAVGRFVPIGQDEYLALTEEVRSKIEALGRAAELSKDGRVPAALLPAIDGMFDGFEVTFAKDVDRRRKAIERANALDVRQPPDLEAELRDYQLDGFAFLVRRTEAGFGACLADDMGLGKTVQAIAVLLHRAERGPALVVAPTSVCRNWEDQLGRFAPGLDVVRFATGNRPAIVQEARAGQVVLVSYALLASERELLSSRTWPSVVFDEAHALKNAATRRWSAASELSADAKIALTGTPVENHTGELHALFDLLVPGMLGSRTAFDKIFGTAIARGERSASGQLRQLVRPFVLRRTKREVLSELPPKTEIVRIVEPTAEHRAFYEAVRRRAVERAMSAKGASGARAGQAHIQMLAEITRLRRAAIDPRLVAGADAPIGSKLEALVELVLELRAAGRRALVFSQFLEVLDLARERLEAHAVTCRRLDGTMTADTRAAEVEAFQHGRADVFLLSLKAGGVGMNLTAADFVILLDPWWNPAVEDQAADRTHRIGQSRPVTVARLVTEGTIEEKVLGLHARKRELFEELIAGADGSGKLDVDALIALLDGAESVREATRSSKASPPDDATTGRARRPSRHSTNGSTP